MDREFVEMLLNQNLTTIKGFVSLMFDQMKQDIRGLREENTELRRSLEFTQAELDDIKRKFTEQEEKIDKCLQSEDTELQHQLRTMQDDVNERFRIIEDFSRRNNVKIEGMEESNEENNEQLQKKVEQLMKNKLKIAPQFESVHRIGVNRNNGLPRPIIARFTSHAVRQSCLRAAPCLKGTHIYLNEDVSKATSDIRRLKMDELKTKRREGMIAYFSGTKLIVKPRSSNTIPQNKDLSSDTSVAGAAPQISDPVHKPEATLDSGAKPRQLRKNKIKS